jgi:hypothetical protein
MWQYDWQAPGAPDDCHYPQPVAKNPKVYDPNNRASMTLIGCGSALGKAIPPYCIFKVWPNRYFAWARGLDDDAAFNQSDTGFSNGDIMLDWLRHSMQTIDNIIRLISKVTMTYRY